MSFNKVVKSKKNLAQGTLLQPFSRKFDNNPQKEDELRTFERGKDNNGKNVYM